MTLTANALNSAASGWDPTTLFGYKVEQKLGEGAGSRLYVVTDPKTRKLYTLKQVSRTTDKDLRFVEQLENEFEVSKQFTHAVLRKSYEIKYTKAMFFKVTEAGLLMEYVEGTPLDKQPSRTVAEVVACFQQVARGLDALHFLGYVHCDMKPSNILTNAEGNVKIIDFGQTCKTATVKERIQGTPDFIAPEQVEKRPVTARTDIFNFGASLYWALSQHKIPTMYTVRKSKRETLRDEQMTPPSKYNPLVPEELSKLVMECIRLDPIHRPRDMGEVVRGLDEFAKTL